MSEIKKWASSTTAYNLAKQKRAQDKAAATRAAKTGGTKPDAEPDAKPAMKKWRVAYGGSIGMGSGAMFYGNAPKAKEVIVEAVDSLDAQKKVERMYKLGNGEAKTLGIAK